MTYQVLARKWRPREFASCVGQEHVVRALTHALEQQRLHHAYLFTGTRGVGKTTLSRIFAKALNCTGPDGAGGITATPCNQCEACTAIDAGRFVDYIEMDAASNRGVDEMTALLERAIYAPSNARFKVYMIDEVHMLTTHAFNAMLKTLEEPPEYVKFILATTDPQKIPVTVLSRCLQFNLKQMTPQHVAQLLSEILHKEGIAAEPAALRMLGQAARGSMRDGLSLLDQAIAYGAGSVTLEGVRGMLGAIDTTVLVRLLDALAARDGKALLALADEMAARSLSFAQGLRDLASLLHRITLAQQVPDSLQEADDAADLARLARQFAADELQLYYQVALHGRNDLHLAPDEYAGFTMTLLRMLAFAPSTTAGDTGSQRAAALMAGRPQNPARPIRLAVPAPAPAAATARPQRAAPAVTAPTAALGAPVPAVVLAAAPAPATEAAPAAVVPLQCADWPALAAQLQVAGLARELAARSELLAVEGDTLRLRVALKTLADQGNVERLKNALSQHFGRPLRLRVDVGSTAGPTATALAEQARAERHERAAAAIYADPFVQQVMKELGATVDPASIRPVGPE
ncbi:MAG: DNA polymerase III subunit gamma/tau [Burkholderiales bacterium]|nr:DNA polymerase III subunit gamma/tau [Burkholderiales bacterium]